MNGKTELSAILYTIVSFNSVCEVQQLCTDTFEQSDFLGDYLLAQSMKGFLPLM